MQVRDVAYLTTSVAFCEAVLAATYLLLGRIMGWQSHAGTVLLLAVPTAALPMYTRLALGAWPALAQLATVSLTLPLFAFGSPGLSVQTFATGLVGMLRVSSRTGRGSILTAGLWAGVAGAAAGLLMAPHDLRAPVLVARVGASLLGGVLSGAMVLAFSPVAERLFGHVTTLTLIEALRYDHPLLLELMAAAPGTFLHSTNLAVLGDAGARAIGADALAVRVGALYHDTGKISSPESFTENQTGANPHDRLTPSESASVLRAHVTDGVELVTRHGLGTRVAEFVREHHGTSVMRSFAHKAGARGADLDSFRYPGPRPRSRETGLLMIADQLEATARATPPLTIDAGLALTQDTVARIASEGQLVDSGLSPRDLEVLTTVFARVVSAIHRRRVRYPPDPAATTPSRLDVLKRLFASRRRSPDR